jgi:hypothetical protein
LRQIQVWTAVYEITNEDQLPLGVSKNTFDLGIVELVQQAMQSVSVTMNVTDQIVSLNSHLVASSVLIGASSRLGHRNRCGCLPDAYPGESLL